MIRNIVFDMGNVIIRFDPLWFMDKEGITDPADRQLVMRELFQSVEWALMDRGDLTEQTAEPRILPRIPDRLKESVRRLLYQWADERDGIEGMEDLVRQLKEAGYGVYLLSNASVAQPAYWTRYPASRYFDGTLISAEVRRIKPMDEIYRIFLDRFRLRAEECVFVDDLSANVAAAVANGWQGIVFHGDVAELKEGLRTLGVNAG